MEYKLITYIPIGIGSWVSTESEIWDNMYMLETVLDWSLLPPNSYGKLYAEIMDDTKNKPEEHTIEIRLMYQQEPAKFIPIPGSEIRHSGSKRWQLKESEWFKLPADPGVSCLWVQGKTSPGGRCAVAFVNIAIAEKTQNEE